MPRKPKVAVIGAGIGGLTAAVALHQRDIDVEVYEQSPQIAEIGAGVSLSPNASRPFVRSGLMRRSQPSALNRTTNLSAPGTAVT